MLTTRFKRRLSRSASTDSKRAHITPRENGWAVRKERNLKASYVMPTQEEAIEIANGWKDKGIVSLVVVHNRTGSFRELD